MTALFRCFDESIYTRQQWCSQGKKLKAKASTLKGLGPKAKASTLKGLGPKAKASTLKGLGPKAKAFMYTARAEINICSFCHDPTK